MEMAPKSNENRKTGPGCDKEETTGEADLQEIASVNNSLDELSEILDEMEHNTENIMAQLRELLQSNREIRSEIQNLDDEKSEPDNSNANNQTMNS